MEKAKRILRRLSFVTNAEFLVGGVFLVSGVIVGWNGIERLQLLYHELSDYFPLKLPENLSQILLHSFPLIFKTFVNTVGSACAVIMGVLWTLSGLGEAFESRKKPPHAPDLEKPEVVAESLRSAQSLYWRSMSLPIRITAGVLPRARLISPITYEMFRRVLVSIGKMVLLGAFIALILYVLGMVPVLAHNHLQWEIRLAVPSGYPLYLVLALLIIANLLIAASLIPYRRREYARHCETMPVCGRGDPHVFFALLEEGCRLLSAQGPARNSPYRVERADNPVIKGTLIESNPKGMPSPARPAGYFCLPLIPLLLSAGFSRLTHFSPEVSSIYFTNFLSLHLLDYVLEVILALALILSGVYFGEWARKLLGVTRFQSAFVFCSLVAEKATGSAASAYSSRRGPGISRLPEWRAAEGLDEAFARWAKNPGTERDFLVEICWAEAVSESESATEEGPRYLTGMTKSEVLQDSMQRLIQLPFHVDLQPALCGDPPTAPTYSGSGLQESPKQREEPPSGDK
ncbi:MAG: hypothetical protein RDU20_08885 [Desulfomonilaceae bacterium]|nr:hypothetical protein [Desulfomonilaceae bacterium]